MFGSHQQLTKINPEPLHAGPDLIELISKVKYLGALLDNTLSFDLHVSSKAQKLWPTLLKSSPYINTSPGKHVPHSS